ncbi:MULTISPECIES: Holliday junction branch migration protein RuvA [Culturomica]|uniref:Holliday junction branch migration protein RuvA n=1 Tax=Culturomica TaxID=1926651 RepID=UPI0003365603|nr:MULTISPECIES: Holliday junction branch migration protein RuvA [Culturomica]CCZ06879.1 holliday junction ATP-dependent DNA helicase RuvA [Odoribacter sp. CAG:788]HBO25738.1 Holliday junction branch migration protein RuvA [Culturomica sp.]
MYEYIKGALVEAGPTYAVVDCGGVGYWLNISVNTYSKISAEKEVCLYVHLIVREDAHLLYGFYSKEERVLFRQLISVSGIGANTANVMLSSMTVDEIVGAIRTGNDEAIRRVKGIGTKTAQRVIIELKDKVGTSGAAESFVFASGAVKEEALAALVMLGFVKAQASKVLDKIVAGGGNRTVEELIKLALKQL